MIGAKVGAARRHRTNLPKLQLSSNRKSPPKCSIELHIYYDFISERFPGLKYNHIDSNSQRQGSELPRKMTTYSLPRTSDADSTATEESDGET